MKPTNTIALRRWLFAAAAVACAIAAGQVLFTLQRQSVAYGLRGHAEGAKVPPAIEFATKTLGSFRAIAIIALWFRASDLQEKGKFFELNDLFRLISQLEPRFAGVWAYWAWNVAYNCSVKFPVSQPEERWRWVRLGIEILRDDGIRINPKAPVLYRELAWIYDHKIGQDSDDAHVFYKVQIAQEMQEALGRPPYLERLKAIAAAPQSETDLLRDPDVRALVGALRAAGVAPFAKPLVVANRAPDLPAAALALLNDPANAGAAARLEAFLRATHLRGKLALDPARMVKLTEQLGPIDWRLPDALSLYWVGRSVELFGADIMAAANSDRMLFHSVVELYRRGTLRFEPGTDEEAPTWIAAPNFGFIGPLVRLHEEIARRNIGNPYETPTREAYLNFLRDAVLNLFLRGDTKSATEYFKRLVAASGEPDGPVADFADQRLKKMVEAMTVQQAMNFARGYFFRSLMSASVGNTDQAVGEENLARFIYEKYRSGHSSPRFQIPLLRELWTDALRDIIRGGAEGDFRKFQVDELRRLYSTDVKKIEDELKRRAEEEQKKREALQPPTPPPAAPPAEK